MLSLGLSSRLLPDPHEILLKRGFPRCRPLEVHHQLNWKFMDGFGGGGEQKNEITELKVVLVKVSTVVIIIIQVFI